MLIECYFGFLTFRKLYLFVQLNYQSVLKFLGITVRACVCINYIGLNWDFFFSPCSFFSQHGCLSTDPWEDVDNKALGFLWENFLSCFCCLCVIPLSTDVGSLNVHV